MRNYKLAISTFAFLAFFASALWAGAPQEATQEKQTEVELVVPEGTVIPIVLTAFLNTRSSQVGDSFYADTTYPVWIQQRLVIPKGSTIRGTVTEVVRPGRIKGKGKLAIRFDDILLPNGVKRDLVAAFRGIHSGENEKIDRKSETVTGGGTKGTEAGTVVGTGSEGAIIGAIVGGGKGAGIGAGAGAAAGLATVLFGRGRDLVLNPGTQFDLELKKPMKFTYYELEFTDAELDNAQRANRNAPARSRTPRTRSQRIGPFPGIGFPQQPI